MPKKPFFTLTFFGWLVFITYSSLTSFSGIDTGSLGFNIPHGDKIVHFIFYSTAAFLGVFYLWEQSKWSVKLRKSLVLMFFLTLVFGIIIEVIQYRFTLDRAGDIFDGLANGIGALCGVLATIFLFSKKRRLNWKQ